MLQLFNTMTRSKEVFEPRDKKVVKMFTCGPSIYRRPHVGNYRTFLWEDLLQRYLEYRGYKVERVINFTDIEDKSIEESKREGLDVADLTGKVSDRFFEETKLLRIKLPSIIPRSSTSIDQAVVIIKKLVELGHAYWHEGDVFFDPLTVKAFGRLFRLDMSRWPKEKRRFKRDTYPGRRWNLGDFILWHGFRSGDDVFWETEIGKGRPSWNIQDPAMITQTLGYAIDIACGGIDNIYRHHDYNIAVIEAASDVEFARYWVHGEHLLVGGKKMSKSLGNIVHTEDLMEKGASGQHLRFYLLYGHHRKTMNLTDERFMESVKRLDDLRTLVSDISGSASGKGKAEVKGEAGKLIEKLGSRFEEAMDDDLSVKTAVDGICKTLTAIADLNKAGALSDPDRARVEETLRRIDTVLQVIFPS